VLEAAVNLIGYRLPNEARLFWSHGVCSVIFEGRLGEVMVMGVVKCGNGRFELAML
jgi:hypothetical protein